MRNTRWLSLSETAEIERRMREFQKYQKRVKINDIPESELKAVTINMVFDTNNNERDVR